MAMPGGLSEEHAADRETQDMVDQMKPSAEEMANKTFDMFNAISYRTQVVAGLNYFVKVQVGDCAESYVELRIFRSLQGDLELTSMKDLDKDSQITYIE